MVLNNLAALYLATNRRNEAEPLMVRAVDILTASLGEAHPHTMMAVQNFEILRQEMAARGE